MKEFAILYKFLMGKASEDELEFSSKLIDYVVVDKYDIRNTEIIFKFEDLDKMGDALNLSDEQISSLYDFRRGTYYYYYDDDDSHVYDFKEGYISFYYYFNDENKKIFDEIYKKIMGEDFKKSSGETKEFTNFMLDLYESEINSINYELGSYMARAKREETLEDFEKSVKNFEEKNGIDLDFNDYTIKVTALDLLMGIVEKSVIEKGYEGFFEKISGHLDIYPYYEASGDSHFDFEGFNRDAYYYLNKILDDINEDASLDDKITKRDKINSLFGEEQNIQLPSNKKYYVRLINYDIKKDLYSIQITNPEKKQKVIQINYDNLLNLFYNPTLFDLDEIY